VICIFVNPRAGKGKALRLSAQLEQALSDRNISFTVYTGYWPETLAGCSEAWIAGGDGTLNYFINHFKDIDIPLALFKGGTGDDFAWKLYGDIPLEEQINLVLYAQPRPVDAGACNGKLFLNSVGIGFDGEVLKSMGTIRKLGGHIGYLWIVLRKIFSFREYQFTIRHQDAEVSGKYLLVNIANSSRTGGGFMISPKADIHDGELNLMTCLKLSVWKRLRFLPVIEKGNHLGLPFVQHELVKHIHIDTESESYAQIDGELIRASHYNINILPGHFKFRY
jgi:diacylglycerol kinase family enzyme